MRAKRNEKNMIYFLKERDSDSMENTITLNQESEKRCYTVKEIQTMLGISRPTVYDLLQEKKFRWFKIGNKYRISKNSFDEWLDQQDEE